MQKFLLRRKRKATGKVVFYGQYALGADDKPKRVCLDTADKKIAERKLDKLFLEAQQEEAGLIQPESVRANAAKSLLEHLEDFLREKALAGNDERYLYGLKQAIKRLVKECGWTTLKKVTPDSFEGWRGKQNLNAKTLNDYLTYARTLLNWMDKRGRIEGNPLKTVEFAKKGKASIYQRRALSDDEVTRLLAVAGVRAFVYQTVLLTGLRRSEVAALQMRDLHLVGEYPQIRLRAETTKNGKADVLPIHPGLVSGLASRAADCEGPTAPVFRRLPTMEEMRLDLCAAGIPFVDKEGRRADFHALRHTFCTNLHRAGLPRRMAMELMRHHDPRLTDKIYADGERLETASGLALLKGHGTHGESPRGTHNGTHATRPAGNHLTQADTGSAHKQVALTTENQGVDSMGIKLTQLEPKGERVRGTGFEPVTPTVSE